jgi:Family of unknown function (DUF5670)
VLAIIAVALLVLWLLGFLAFHLTAGAMHILLGLPVVAIIVHIMRGGRSSTVWRREVTIRFSRRTDGSSVLFLCVPLFGASGG